MKFSAVKLAEMLDDWRMSVDLVARFFVLAQTNNVTQGQTNSVQVTALDAHNNRVSSYAGTVHLSSSDGAASLPGDHVLSSGQFIFSPVVLDTIGTQTITASDTATPAISGTSTPIVVISSGDVVDHLFQSGPAVFVFGYEYAVTVQAQNSVNGIVTSYAGTVHFTSSDVLAVLPDDNTLVSGVGTFTVTLFTLGTQSVTATDVATASLTAELDMTVVPRLQLREVPAAAAAGVPVSTITAVYVDANDAPLTGYSGEVMLCSSDPAAQYANTSGPRNTLPTEVELANGAYIFDSGAGPGGGFGIEFSAAGAWALIAIHLGMVFVDEAFAFSGNLADNGWTDYSGTNWQASPGQASLVVPVPSIAVLELGVSEGVFSVDVYHGSISNVVGLAIGMADGDNGWLVIFDIDGGSLQIVERSAGSNTVQASVSCSGADFVTVIAIVTGTVISARVNGITVQFDADGHTAIGTQHGMFCSGTFSVGYFNHFRYSSGPDLTFVSDDIAVS